jgi:hypothetical protein
VLRGILDGIPDHPAVHGFVRGRSALTGAAVHTGAGVVVCLDLAAFFPSVTAGRVWGTLRGAGYPEPVAHLLTGLLTHAVPAPVIAAMPASGNGALGDPRAFRLRRYLARPHLPQGAPGSPAVANLVCRPLDRRLDAYAAACGARYTRYADDLTFSGGPEFGRRAGRFIAAVGRLVQQEGFRLNAAKTRVRRPHQRQAVTGIVVNARPNVPRPEADRLRGGAARLPHPRSGGGQPVRGAGLSRAPAGPHLLGGAAQPCPRPAAAGSVRADRLGLNPRALLRAPENSWSRS